MTIKEICDLITRFESGSLQSMKLSTGDFSIELDRGNAVSAAPVQTTAPVATVQVDNVITAPLVGVFYAAPAPDAAPFVKAGDRVQKGQILCLMEAMKMLSEVSAPCDCIITEVLKKNAALASFNEPLFRYQPC